MTGWGEPGVSASREGHAVVDRASDGSGGVYPRRGQARLRKGARRPGNTRSFRLGGGPGGFPEPGASIGGTLSWVRALHGLVWGRLGSRA